MYVLAHPPVTPSPRYISGSGANSPVNKAPGATRTGTSATSFRRTYIVCETPPQQQSQSQESAAFYKAALEKAQGRIGSLETTIEKLQAQHRGSLTDLHKEIARLQNVCSVLLKLYTVATFPLTVKQIPVPPDNTASPPFLADETIEMRTPWSKKNAVYDIDTKSNDDETDDSNPCYILLQQRRKDQGFIERMNSDNKRKQSEIAALSAELEFVRNVLSVSGLDVGLVQLKGLVNGRDRTKELPARARKMGVNVLPPIGAPSAEGDVTSNESGPGTVVLDSRMNDQQAIMSPSVTTRPDKINQKPRDYHNANLDYHGRGFLCSVPPPLPPPSTDSLAVSAEKAEMLQFPPMKTPLPDILDSAGGKSESWTGRLKGAQMLRQRTWQSRNK
ncbi:hypothetical protein BC830DRAFT_1085592 [Chytriomyces sp. MP71]|nr:hypothetical protein BC830DRAFT_1085592 [Chytriomyces sp. MP71]